MVSRECGALLSTLLSLGCLPAMTSSISPRIEIMASQKRSSSWRDSLSVGSINMAVWIGQAHVGGWKDCVMVNEHRSKSFGHV